MKKIIALTPEQEAYLPVFREEWYRRASAAEPCDRPAMMEVWRKMYQAIGTVHPPMIIWMDGPATALLFLHMLHSGKIQSLRSSLKSSLGSSLRSSLGSSLRSSLRSSLESSLESSLRSSLGSSLESSLGSSLESSLGSSLWSSLPDGR